MSDSSDLPVLDLDHLSRMTGGDEELAAEVIGIFQEQAALWGRLLSAQEPAEIWADAAHTIKGAALGIGAIRLARYCERAENLGRSKEVSPAQSAVALDDVRAALGEALEAAAAAAHKFAVSAGFSASNASNS
ncbi:MAG: Hpt domain-containing protein [Hyphomonadaceae bacterium]|nr:Hpt domain-containing protein [Hyphomonadaceae bacterium]